MAEQPDHLSSTPPSQKPLKFEAAKSRLLRRREKRKRRSGTKLPASTNIKAALLFFSVLIVIGTLIYSHQLVEQLKTREYRVAKLFADAVLYNANAEQPPDDSLYHMILSYTETSGVPIILSDPKDVPNVNSFKKFNLNIPFDSTLDSIHQVQFLEKRMQEMDQVYDPLPVYFHDPTTKQDIVTNYIHYGDSAILNKIETVPYIQLLLGAVIVVIGYLSFSYLKRSEQSNIWVGMAKETAHQLGTPLSSLLGWCELLRLSSDSPQEVEKIAGEIERDVERLNRIAIRFSKIGSIPDLKPQNVVLIISDVLNYFEGRMPHLRKNITLELNSEEDEIILPLNRELFEWVMENLVKNAFEAIEQSTGSIKVHIHKTIRKDAVIIDVTDTGKGFDMRHKKDVFRPGFSTKARGWGLGLSLARRIIEDYHHGKLFVKESHPGQGTTFRIRLTLHT
jgi:signal transduction histidine kinase